MKTIKGFTVYDKDESIILPSNVPMLPDNAISQFGWKLSLNNNNYYWEPMSQNEYLVLVGILTNIEPNKIPLFSCSMIGGTCSSGCAPGDGDFCVPVQTPDRIFCLCIGFIPKD